MDVQPKFLVYYFLTPPPPQKKKKEVLVFSVRGSPVFEKIKDLIQVQAYIQIFAVHLTEYRGRSDCLRR